MSDTYILVTGAAGLIGNAVRVALEDSGRAIIAIDKSSGDVNGRPVLAVDVTDVHGLHRLAHSRKIGGIVHCGAFSGPMVAADRPVQMVDVNIVGTANILELARIIGDVRVVNCSSTSAVGPTPVTLSPVSETVIPNPSTIYGVSKVASESLVDGYRRQFSVDGVSIRLSWVYGPRRQTSCVIRQMIEDALFGRPTRLPFGRDFPRQFIHVSDAANALILALDHPKLPQGVYNATGDEFVTLSQVAEIVCDIEKSANIELDKGPDPQDDMQARFDISAAMRDFNFTPKVKLTQGIKTYRDWLLDELYKTTSQ